MAKKEVSVKTELKDNFKLVSKTRDHKAITDQPGKMGDDQGPTPLEYLFISLGGCIGTIGKIVAKEKGIDLKNMEVKIDGHLNPNVLFGKNEEERAGFQNIKVKTKIEADMTEEEKKEFIEEVDERCPISDNISNQSPIKFEIV